MDSRRNVHAVALALLGEPGPLARRARVVDDLAAAAAALTGLRDREDSLALRIDAAALAARAGVGGGADLGARAAAGRTRRLLGHGDRDLGARHRLVERQRHVGLEVIPPHRGAATPAGEE